MAVKGLTEANLPTGPFHGMSEIARAAEAVKQIQYVSLSRTINTM